MSHPEHDGLRFEQAVVNCLLRILDIVTIAKLDMEELMLDTQKLLAAVAREKSDNASLRALVEANTTALRLTSQQMADIQAKLDAALNARSAADPSTGAADLKTENDNLRQQLSDAMAQIASAQGDVDKAVADLSSDSDAAEAALAANVQPSGASAGTISSSSSSTASGGGAASDKPQPLPGTGQPAPDQPAAPQAPAAAGNPGTQAGGPNPGQVDPTQRFNPVAGAGAAPLASDPNASAAGISGDQAFAASQNQPQSS